GGGGPDARGGAGTGIDGRERAGGAGGGGAEPAAGLGGGGGGLAPAAGRGGPLGWSKARAVSSPPRSKTVVFSSSSSQSISMGAPGGAAGVGGNVVAMGVGMRPGTVSTSSVFAGGTGGFNEGAGGGGTPGPFNVAGGAPGAGGNTPGGGWLDA